MKKIFLILSLLLAYIAGFSQLDSSSNIFNDLRGNVWYKASNIPAWQIDGYRAIIFNGDTLIRGNSGVFRAEEVEVYANGSDMSSPLQDAFDYSGIKWISFGSDSVRTYVFNSSVNAHGKTVKFENGNKLDGNGTIDSITVDASDYDQIFGTSLTVTNVKGTKGYISPNWWGAIGNGSTDAIIPIQKAFNQQNVTVKFPKLSYYISDTVTLHWSNNIEMPAGSLLLCNTSGVIAGSYDDSYQVQMRGKSYSFRVERVSQSNWSDTNNIGIKLVNINYSEVQYVSASKFTIGMKTIGYDAGLAYVNYNLGLFEKNMVDIWIATLSPHELAWNNQNNYYGGWFRNGSENSGMECWGVWFGNGNYSITNNIFQGTSIEKRSNAKPWKVISGSRNKMYDFRSEGNSDTVAHILKNGTSNSNNFIFAGRDGGTGKIIDSSYGGTNFYTSAEKISVERSNYTVVAELNNIVDNCVYSGPDSLINIAPPGLFQERTGSLFPTNTLKAEIVDDYLYIRSSNLYALSTDYIDASIVKKFVIKQNALSGAYARVFVSLFNKNGQNISSAISIQTPYTQSYTSTYGGSISISNDDADVRISIPDTVKKIMVRFGRGNNDVKIRSYKIISYQEGASIVYSTVASQTSINVAPSKPTIGSYIKGTVIYNSDPNVDSVRGWMCSASGTFSTLSGVTGTISNGSTQLVLNSGSGALVQKRQWLSLNSVPSQIIGISGDTVWINRALTGGTITGGSINYATPSFIDLSPIGNDTLYASFARDGDSIRLVLGEQDFAIYSPLSYSNEFTPTITDISNVSSSTVGDFRYTITDSVVHCSGKLSVTPSASTTLTVVQLSLPISSALPSGAGCWGGAFISESSEFASGQISGDSGTDRAVLSFKSLSNSAHTITVEFTYTVN